MGNYIFGMLFPSSLAVLSLIFTLTQAVPFPGPLPTVAYEAADITPQPTNTPQANTEPVFGSFMTNSAVCGWIGGDSSLPITCSSGSTCVYDSVNKIVGCCPSGSSCTSGIYTSCVDARSPQKSSFSPSIITCYGQAVCYVNSYPDGYQQYGCGSLSDATTVETTFSGQNPGVTLEIVRITIAFSTPSSSFISSVKTQQVSNSSTQISTTSTTPILTSLRGTTSISTSSQGTTSILTSSQGSTGNGSQVAITSTESEVAVSGQGNQAQLGLIIGCLIGGIGALFALLAIGVYLIRRRRNSREPEVYLFPPVEKRSSSSSFASSRLPGHVRVNSSDSDATVSTNNPFPYSNMYSNDPPALPEPQVEPEVSPESALPQYGRSNPYSAISIDDAAGLPSTWARPITPLIPPRSLKRKPLPPVSTAIHHTNSHSHDLEAGRQKTTLHLSNSVCTVASSVYSRATDGNGYLERDSNVRRSRTEEEIPPLPQLTNPEQNGCYIVPLRNFKEATDNRVGSHLTTDQKVESNHAYPQTAPLPIEQNPSPTFSWASEDTIFGWEVRVDESRVRAQNKAVSHIEDEGDVKIAPLRLSLRPKNAVEKVGGSPVPILGDPKDLTPGERERRLYEV